MLTISKTSDGTSMAMGAISRHRALTESNPVESAGGRKSSCNNRIPDILLTQHDKSPDDEPPGDQMSSINHSSSDKDVASRLRKTSRSNGSSPKRDTSNTSFHSRARKLLNFPSGHSLRSSASTGCLLVGQTSCQSSSANQSNLAIGGANDNDNNSPTTSSSSQSSTPTPPTRASLTHDWKKLKAPTKCRECNLLVYFNGRECSSCGFVAHKKCVTVLVIRCIGQDKQSTSIDQMVRSHSGSVSSPERTKSIIYAKLRSNSNDQTIKLCEPTQDNQGTVQGFKGEKVKKVSSKSVVRPIFGKPISVDGDEIVDFVSRFVHEIDSRGLTSRGIYRVSSIKSKVEKLCNYYNQNLSSLIDLSSFHPTIIANTLKLYLRQLPEPLLTHELYTKFIEFAKKYPKSSLPPTQKTQPSQQPYQQAPALSLPNKTRRSLTGSGIFSTISGASGNHSSSLRGVTSYCDTRRNQSTHKPILIAELRQLIDLLPPINRELTAIIMQHLKRVADMSAENQMSATNLSIIFGPTLLSAENKSLAIVDNIHQARVVELMIECSDKIFLKCEKHDRVKSLIDLKEKIPTDEVQVSASRVKMLSSSWSSKRGDDPIISQRPNRQLFCLKQVTATGKDKSANASHDDATRRPVSVHSTATTSTPNNTRDDLREMRRQFFNLPSTASAPLRSSQQFTGSVGGIPRKDISTTSPTKVEVRRKSPQSGESEYLETPQTTTVIGLRPHFCDWLRNSLKANENSNKP